jgi:hypothetical protein
MFSYRTHTHTHTHTYIYIYKIRSIYFKVFLSCLKIYFKIEFKLYFINILIVFQLSLFQIKKIKSCNSFVVILVFFKKIVNYLKNFQ